MILAAGMEKRLQELTVDIAKKVIQSEDIRCMEAIDVDVENKYEGLDKTFYFKNDFINFSNKIGAKCLTRQPENQLYCKNKFVFNC